MATSTDTTNVVELTLYFVGTDKADAQSRFPFDSHESAQDYSLDNPGTHVYSVLATVDFSGMERS